MSWPEFLEGMTLLAGCLVGGALVAFVGAPLVGWWMKRGKS